MKSEQIEQLAKHTAGPWTVGFAVGGTFDDVESGKGEVVGFRVSAKGKCRSIVSADCNDGQSKIMVLRTKEDRALPWASEHFTPEEMQANGFLIAAAPQMFDSLEPDVLEAIADEIDCHEHSVRAHSLRVIAKAQRAAIEKATKGPK